jgi:potassium-transporting ATPase ATP-binding subunit
VVYIGALVATFIAIKHGWEGNWSAFECLSAFWIWLAVFLANMAEGLALHRSMAYIDTQNKIKKDDYGNTYLNHALLTSGLTLHKKTRNEIKISLFLSAITFLLLLTVMAFKVFIDFLYSFSSGSEREISSLTAFIVLLICMIPTSLGALLSTISIGGIDRLFRQRIIAKKNFPLEDVSDIDLLLIDKSGIITSGNRIALEFIPAADISSKELVENAYLASLLDETVEGQSIVALARKEFSFDKQLDDLQSKFIPFSANTRISGLDIQNEMGKTVKIIRKGAVDVIREYTEGLGGIFPAQLQFKIDQIAGKGGTPLLVSSNHRILGIIHLEDTVKEGIRKGFIEIRNLGIRTLLVTGDSALSAANICAEVGIDDFLAEATLQDKLNRIVSEQKIGYLVAMMGKGEEDATALTQANIGISMKTGPMTAFKSDSVIDLEGDPTQFLDILRTSKQLLITRGALLLFFISSDSVKYFALLPAFLDKAMIPTDSSSSLPIIFNIMRLHSPSSAILSTLIFSVISIALLIPLALNGVSFHSQKNKLLFNHILIYGIGGLIVSFIGIKILDSLITALKIV